MFEKRSVFRTVRKFMGHLSDHAFPQLLFVLFNEAFNGIAIIVNKGTKCPRAA